MCLLYFRHLCLCCFEIFFASSQTSANATAADSTDTDTDRTSCITMLCRFSDVLST